jgi:hypothetical protein
MGLMDKFRGAMEKAVDKMDAMSEPAAGSRHEWREDQPMAVLVESEWRPGARMHSDSGGADLTDLAAEALTGIPYRFVLEVRHRPGMAPYRIELQARVPSKVQRSLTQGEVHVPAGAEVPLRVTGPNPADIEIDWDGYLALPGRKQEAERLRAEAQWDRIGAEFERKTKPAQVQKIRAANRMAALAWADAVLAGQMTRARFDQGTQQSLRMGHLLPEDLAAAVAKLDR